MREYYNPVPDATQKNCKHGWVLPDRCRYNPLLGCDCGEYPAWTKERWKEFYEQIQPRRNRG